MVRQMVTASSFSPTVQHRSPAPSPTLTSPVGLPSITDFSILPFLQLAQFVELDDPARTVKHPAHLDAVVAASNTYRIHMRLQTSIFCLCIAVVLL